MPEKREFTILGVFEDKISDKLESILTLINRAKAALENVGKSDPFGGAESGLANLSSRLRQLDSSSGAIRNAATAAEQLGDSLDSVYARRGQDPAEAFLDIVRRARQAGSSVEELGDTIAGVNQPLRQVGESTQSFTQSLLQITDTVVQRIVNIGRAFGAIGRSISSATSRVTAFARRVNDFARERFTGFIRSLRQIRDGFDRIGPVAVRSLSRIRNVVRSIRRGLANLSTQFVALVGAFLTYTVLSRATEEARNFAEAQALLKNATQNSSSEFNRASSIIDKFVGKLAFSRAEITQAASQIIRLGESAAGLERDLNAALNIAAASPSRTLEDVARDIPRLPAGYLGELGEMIPALRGAQDNGTLATEGIKIIEQFFEGAALEQAATKFGEADKAAKELGASLRFIGEQVTIIKTLFSQEIKVFVDEINEAFNTNTGKAFLNLFKDLSRYAKEIAVAIGSFVGIIVSAKLVAIFGPIAITITNIVLALTAASTILKTIAVSTGLIGEDFKLSKLEVDKFTQAIADGRVELEDFIRLFNGVADYLSSIFEGILGIIKAVVGLPIAFVKDMTLGFEELFLTLRVKQLEAIQFLQESAKKAIDLIPGANKFLFDAAINFAIPDKASIDRDLEVARGALDLFEKELEEKGTNTLNVVGQFGADGFLAIRALRRAADDIGDALESISNKSTDFTPITKEAVDNAANLLDKINQIEGIDLSGKISRVQGTPGNELASRSLDTQIQEFQRTLQGPLISEDEILSQGAVSIVKDRLASIPKDKQIQESYRSLLLGQVQRLRQSGKLGFSQFLDLAEEITKGGSRIALAQSEKNLQAAEAVFQAAVQRTAEESKRLDEIIKTGAGAALRLNFEPNLTNEEISVLAQQVADAETALQDKISLNNRKAQENLLAAQKAASEIARTGERVDQEFADFSTKAIESEVGNIKSIISEFRSSFSSAFSGVSLDETSRLSSALGEVISKFQEARGEVSVLGREIARSLAQSDVESSVAAGIIKELSELNDEISTDGLYEALRRELYTPVKEASDDVRQEIRELDRDIAEGVFSNRTIEEIQSRAEPFNATIDAITSALQDFAEQNPDLAPAINKLIGDLNFKKVDIPEKLGLGEGFASGIQGTIKQLGDLGEVGRGVGVDLTRGLFDAIGAGLDRGTRGFREFIQELLRGLARAVAQALIFKAILAALNVLIPGSGTFLGFASGAAAGAKEGGRAGDVPTTRFNFDSSFQSALSKYGVQHFDTGGRVPGPRVNRDIIPAVLSPDEHVIRTAATDYYGHDAMAAINDLLAPRDSLRGAIFAGKQSSKSSLDGVTKATASYGNRRGFASGGSPGRAAGSTSSNGIGKSYIIGDDQSLDRLLSSGSKGLYDFFRREAPSVRAALGL